MQEEYDSLIKNKTWSPVDHQRKRVLPCKWVYKIKTNEKGEIIRFKARLVFKSYAQRKGSDYDETYAPVQTVAFSTAEAEYIAMAAATQEALCLRQLQAELGQGGDSALLIHCDNQSAIRLASTDCYKPKTKHIDIRLHFLRENVVSNFERTKTREKWNTVSYPVSVETVVLIITYNALLQRLLGEITKVYPGRDGIIHVAQVKIKRAQNFFRSSSELNITVAYTLKIKIPVSPILTQCQKALDLHIRNRLHIQIIFLIGGQHRGILVDSDQRQFTDIIDFIIHTSTHIQSTETDFSGPRFGPSGELGVMDGKPHCRNRA
ncbi:Retrovirus-related Pol polyprotein from transposon TNT 1-94 [Eumeta japonica]|uniref:Retrovirus-related Pol polyprotein from transposon TNT 1-94 n=1 Tax=Eumeta variegata TaxID=151549 RepID=A0A4C1VML2_EUMVA|nr:Retrovirus-related Pol polyprotein from transposon TNT 1-94 [Eumeta japonica]